MHISDCYLNAGGQRSHEGVQVVQFLTNSSRGQAIVDQQHDLRVGRSYGLPRGQRLFLVVHRDRQSRGARRRRGLGIDVDQHLRRDRAFLLRVCGEAERQGKGKEEGGNQWTFHRPIIRRQRGPLFVDLRVFPRENTPSQAVNGSSWLPS